LTINKENILAPGVIIPNKPPDNNKEDHKKYYQTATSLLLAGILTKDIRKVLVPKVYVDPKTKIPEHIYITYSPYKIPAKQTNYRLIEHMIIR
jgi:hypothetical protein